MIYVAGSLLCGLLLPRIEQLYLMSFDLGLSVSSTQAYLSAAASGMMALTGVVFAMAFVMVQFSAIAYSPRLVLWFAQDHVLFHSLGVFAATFIYSLSALAWVDRAGSGRVPTASALLVFGLLIASMVLFSWLVQRLTALQITNVLQVVGDKGRAAIREMFQSFDDRHKRGSSDTPQDRTEIPLGPISQTLRYSGDPSTIAKMDIGALLNQARRAEAVIAMACSVGDTLLESSVVLRVHRATTPISETELMRAVHLATERTFEQDPKYPIRLLVDIAIKALSPAINDPTTAVQAIDQIEDLLRRLSAHDLDAGFIRDDRGNLRVIVPMPTWEDYLTLAFDEIRQFGSTSIQVMRRLRAALSGLSETTTSKQRLDAVRRYLTHFDKMIEGLPLDAEDREMVLVEDRQGLGLSRKSPHSNSPSSA